MASTIHAKRVFYKAQTGLASNSIAELEAAYFEGLTAGTVAASPVATVTVAGSVKKAATVANATDAASVITQLNLLLTNMRAAGQIV